MTYIIKKGEKKIINYVDRELGLSDRPREKVGFFWFPYHEEVEAGSDDRKAVGYMPARTGTWERKMITPSNDTGYR